MVLLAIFFHLGNYNLWPEMKTAIKSVYDTGHSVDLYVSYQVKTPILDQIVDEFKTVTLTETKLGLDIGGELLNLEKSILSQKQYDYVLILHTKTDPTWRRTLTDATCKFSETVSKCINLFQSDPTIGIIGSSRYIYKLIQHNFNHPKLVDMCSRWNLKYDQTSHNLLFVAGTIFWIRWNILKQFVVTNHVNLSQEYARLEPGYFTNKNPTFTHTWERLYGIITLCYGYRIHGHEFGVTIPPEFNWQLYLDRYPDLRMNGVMTREQAIRHYLNYGYYEGRSGVGASQSKSSDDQSDTNQINNNNQNVASQLPMIHTSSYTNISQPTDFTQFNWIRYISKYPDLPKNGILTKEAALRHYITYGMNEGRTWD
jgi:lipopolysaccharide biosynthesis protein